MPKRQKKKTQLTVGSATAPVAQGQPFVHPGGTSRTVPLEARLPTDELEPKNELIRAAYEDFIPTVGQFLDCGLKVQGLLTKLRNNLSPSHALNDMGLTVRIVRGRDNNKITLRGEELEDGEWADGWTGEYHVYLRSEDDAGNNYLYDPYINAENCRGTTDEDSALPELWKTAMGDMEFFSVAGAGTDIPISEYMENYEGKWESLVKHAQARASDPSIAGTYEGWWG